MTPELRSTSSASFAGGRNIVGWGRNVVGLMAASRQEFAR